MPPVFALQASFLELNPENPVSWKILGFEVECDVAVKVREC